MFADIFEVLGGHGFGVIFGLLLGSTLAWIIARWRRHQQRRSVLMGDARNTIVINCHLVEKGTDVAGKKTAGVLRLRSLGQGELSHVVPNGHLAAELLHRAFQVTPRHTLISMEGAEGSYLLETLTNFVCDRIANSPFEHDLYVMAPCCEPAGLAEHQPITILLIAVQDLVLFESWPGCREIQVERGSDGARVLTLMDLAKRFREEQAKIEALRRAGKRTRFVETMYILDLPLDKKFAAIPVKSVTWGRFEDVLKQMNLE